MPSEAEARKVLEAADFTDAASLDAVIGLAPDSAAIDAATKVLKSRPLLGPLWAATLTYATGGPNPDLLAPLLKREEPTIRLLAATGLVDRGDQRGFPPLIKLLSEAGVVLGSDPPVPLWLLATQALVRATGLAELGPPFDADAPLVEAGYRRWTAWYRVNRDKLVFANARKEWDVV